jgi:processive 1,2-diacylglycerol beta-glucosyltransferase
MKVMILYANAGDGHRRAAEALAAICEQDDRISEYRLVDALDFTSKIFRDLYANLYLEAVKKAPLLWSKAFDDSDQPWAKEKGRMLVHRLNGQPLAKEIIKFNPDLCLSTHFMPSDIISTLLRQEAVQTDLCVVVTDYYVHASWLESYVNRVYVAKEESREQLLRLKFPPKRVKTLGIPIDPLFEKTMDRETLCAKHGIDTALPLVLLSAGAFGVMSGSDMALILSGITSPCQLAVVCGKNKKLKSEIEKYVAAHPAENMTHHILGFTKEMHEWMAMASLFIGKPGGLSTSECLASGLPMVVWHPIPGQEVFNSIYLLENGAAISPDSISTLSFRVDQLLRNPTRLQAMQAAAKDLSRPDAARAIVNDAIEHLDEGLVRIPTGRTRLSDR